MTNHYSHSSNIHFEWQDWIGSGSAGSVDKVRGKHGPFHGRVLARKQIHIESQDRDIWLKRVTNEINILKGLRHPHTIQLVATYIFENTYEIIACPCAQGDLRQHLEATKKPTSQDLDHNAQWFGCLMNGLSYIHRQGIQHRDIKPANILIEDGNILFADFSISSINLDTKTSTTDLGAPRARTREYCAPEVEDGHTRTQAADVFSLGAVFVDMINLYFDGKKHQDLRALKKADKDWSYAGHLDEVMGWINHLGEELRHSAQWKLEALDLCRVMLNRKSEQRPGAVDLSLRWSYQPPKDLPTVHCRCTSGVGNEEHPENANKNEILETQLAKGNWWSAQRLEESGATISAQRRLLAAAEGDLLNHVENLLQDKSGPVNGRGVIQRAARGGASRVLKLLLEKSYDVNELDSDGHTALIEAILKSQEETVDQLLGNGADANLASRAGEIPLCIAAESGNRAMVRALLENGANVDLKDNNKETALVKSAKYGRYRVAKLLLEKAHNDLLPALTMAVEAGHSQLTRLLLDCSIQSVPDEVAQSMGSIIFQALEFNYKAIVDLLIDTIADMHVRIEEFHKPALFWVLAAKTGHNKMVHLVKGYIRSNPDTAVKVMSELLPLAASCGQKHIVELFLENEAQVSFQETDRGWTALHGAASLGDKEIMRLLIEKGADPKVVDNDGRTPLYVAIEFQDEDLVNILLNAGANYSVFCESGRDPLELAFASQNEKAVRLLLRDFGHVIQQAHHEWGSSFDIEKEAEVLQPVMKSFYDSIEMGPQSMAQVILKALPSLPGVMVKHLISLGDEEKLRVLLSRVEQVQRKIYTPEVLGGALPYALKYDAAHSGNKMLRFLLDHGANTNLVFQNDETALFQATVGKLEEAMEILLAHGADANKELKNGWTVLDYVASTGDVLLARILLRNGANIHRKSDGGSTPLHSAAYHGHEEMVELLADNNAIIDALEDEQKCPLALAVSQGHESVVKVLLRRGADLNARIPKHDGPFDFCSASELSDNLPLHLAAVEGSCTMVSLLLKHGADVAARDHLKRTPLHKASESGHWDVVELFLNHGANIKAVDFGNNTALHMAAERGHVQVVRMLINRGANCNARNKNIGKYLKELVNGGKWGLRARMLGYIGWGWKEDMSKKELDQLEVGGGDETPLHLAADSGSAETVQALLEGGADVGAKNRWKNTALEIAKKRKHGKVVKLLCDNGAAEGGWQTVMRSWGSVRRTEQAD